MRSSPTTRNLQQMYEAKGLMSGIMHWLTWCWLGIVALEWWLRIESKFLGY